MLPSLGTMMELGGGKNTVNDGLKFLVQWNARKQNAMERKLIETNHEKKKNLTPFKNEGGKVISLTPVGCHDTFESAGSKSTFNELTVSAERCEGEKRHRRRKSNSNKKFSFSMNMWCH